jgi:hypothetical protein
MTKPSFRALAGVAAAASVAIVASASGAKADCWWNGFAWNCSAPAPMFGQPAPYAYPAYAPAPAAYPAYPAYPSTMTGAYPGPRTN